MPTTTLQTTMICEFISNNINFLMDRIKEIEEENNELKKKLEEANGRWEQFVADTQYQEISTSIPNMSDWLNSTSLQTDITENNTEE